MDLKIFKSSAGLHAFVNLLQQISDLKREILSYLLNHRFPHLLMSQIDFDMCSFGVCMSLNFIIFLKLFFDK